MKNSIKHIVLLGILTVMWILSGMRNKAEAMEDARRCITEIYDLDILTMPVMVREGSNELEDWVTGFDGYPMYAVCRDGDESTEIYVSYDFSQVDMSKKGTYVMKAVLEYDHTQYMLSKEYKEEYDIPVCVSDPAKFEVFPTYNSQFQVSLSYLYNFTTLESMKAEYCYSDTPLTYKELGKADWQIMEACGEMNPAPDAIMLSAEFCRKEAYLYIKFVNEGVESNILCLAREERGVCTCPIEGDRDGGDFVSGEEDDRVLISPVVSEPEKTEEQKQDNVKKVDTTVSQTVAPSVKSETKKTETEEKTDSQKQKKQKMTRQTKVEEQGEVQGITTTKEVEVEKKKTAAAKKQSGKVTSYSKKDDSKIVHAEETTKVETIRGDTTAITGKRLRLMAASHPVWMPFDQDMVKLEIPTKFLLSLGLKDTELLRVVIERRQGDGVSIRIFKGEKEITKIPGSRLTWKQNVDMVPVSVSQTGNYKIPSSVSPQKLRSNTVPLPVMIILAGIALGSLGCFVYRRKERKL